MGKDTNQEASPQAEIKGGESLDGSAIASPSASRSQRPDGATHCYVGRKACGCWVAACVDAEDHKDDTADAIAEYVREGLIVTRELISEVRINLKSCPHGRVARGELREPQQTSQSQSQPPRED